MVLPVKKIRPVVFNGVGKGVIDGMQDPDDLSFQSACVLKQQEPLFHPLEDCLLVERPGACGGTDCARNDLCVRPSSAAPASSPRPGVRILVRRFHKAGRIVKSGIVDIRMLLHRDQRLRGRHKVDQEFSRIDGAADQQMPEIAEMRPLIRVA